MKICLLAALISAVAAFSPTSAGRRTAMMTRLDASRRDAVSTMLAQVSAATLLVPSRAAAGVGAVAPFDTARRLYLPGALLNSVAALRIESALRWINISESRRVRNKAYYNPKHTVVGSLRCPDDVTPVVDSLGGMLGKDYAGVTVLSCKPGGTPTNLAEDISTLASKLPEKVRTSGGGNVIIVFGPHVGISKDGRVGAIESSREEVSVSEYAKAGSGDGSDSDARAVVAAAKQAYRPIREEVEAQVAALSKKGGIWDEGIAELTLVGGLTINRAKFGEGRGEDCFYPLSLYSMKPDGTIIDRYDGAFGDMDIPAKDRN